MAIKCHRQDSNANFPFHRAKVGSQFVPFVFFAYLCAAKGMAVEPLAMLIVIALPGAGHAQRNEQNTEQCL